MLAHQDSPTDDRGIRSSQGAVAIVSSAGGIGPLIEVLSSLPEHFPLPIFVAQHLARNAASVLPSILSWHAGRRNIRWASSGDIPRHETVYVVPPGSSLAVRPNGFLISALGSNPTRWLRSPDVLLQSLVDLYGAGTVAITLSGMMPAGVNGLRAVRAAGGITMAQSQATSMHFDMPRAATDFGKADAVFPPKRMAQALAVIAKSRVNEPAH